MIKRPADEPDDCSQFRATSWRGRACVVAIEPHPIRRISDGGPDGPAYVISLCPHCDRRIHAGENSTIYNETLLAAMTSIEL
jgi:hypothetical protein